MKQFGKSMAQACAAAAVAVGFAAPAHALDLAVLGNYNIGTQSQTNLAATYTAGSTNNFGFGATLAFDSFPMVKSELGALYVKRGMTLSDSASGGGSTSTYSYLMVPYMLRFEPVSLLSVGVGAYYAYGLGEYTIASSIPGLSNNTSTYEASGYSRSDFGLIAGASFKFPLVPLVSMRLDVDYAFGLSNLYANAGGSASFRDLMIMAGVNIGI